MTDKEKQQQLEAEADRICRSIKGMSERSPDCDAESCSASNPETPPPDGLPHSAERRLAEIRNALTLGMDRAEGKMNTAENQVALKEAHGAFEAYAEILSILVKESQPAAVAPSEARCGRRNAEVSHDAKRRCDH